MHTAYRHAAVARSRPQGVPTLESLQSAAPLVGLPQPAREEAHRWERSFPTIRISWSPPTISNCVAARARKHISSPRLHLPCWLRHAVPYICNTVNTFPSRPAPPPTWRTVTHLVPPRSPSLPCATRRLLWRMMHEALPPNASAIPFDADAFSSTFDTQPPRLQVGTLRTHGRGMANPGMSASTTLCFTAGALHKTRRVHVLRLHWPSFLLPVECPAPAISGKYDLAFHLCKGRRHARWHVHVADSSCPSVLLPVPPIAQAALSWAWAQHFTAFANDFNYLLECLPYASAASAAVTDSPAAAADAAAALAAGGEASDEELERYQAVLAQMVGFLRDNEMFACLATLLQNAVSRGLALVRHGKVCGMSPHAAAAVAAFSTPLVLDAETASEPGTPAAAASAAAAVGGNRNGALAAALAALTAAVAAGSGAAGGDDADDAAGGAYSDRLLRAGSGSLASWCGDSAPPSPCRTPYGAPAKPEEPGPSAAFGFILATADSAATASTSAAAETPAAQHSSIAAKTACAAAPAASSRLAAAAVPLLLLVLLALVNAFLCGGARAAASDSGSAASIRRAVSALALLPLAVKAAAALLLPLAAAGSTHAGAAPTAKSGYVGTATAGAMRMAGGCERWAVAVALSATAWRVAGAVEGAEGSSSSSSSCAW